MAFINLIVTKDAKVSVCKNQLKLVSENETDFPLEDINSIMFESLYCNISTYTLNKFAEFGITTFFCDEKHLPNAILIPFNSHFKQSEVFEMQLSLPKPLQKRLWQSIIIQKILNQAKVLEILGKDFVKLIDYSKKVLSGDNQNIEASAANFYFRQLFGAKFIREKECFINACLNYGYAIIRGLIARTLTIHGFTNCIGLKHSNKFNQFNLTDDIIEPFRQIVDLFVANLIQDDNFNELTSEVKYLIYNLINTNVLINNQKQVLHYAVEIVVSSLLNSLKTKNNKIVLPTIIPIEMHEYE